MNWLAQIREDVQSVLSRDPAVSSAAEALLLYPGLHAVWAHRAAHSLWRRNFRFLASVIAHASRAATGIEIHPGSQLGRRVFIDHGMGVVIGETAVVGDDVTLYQGVVLGGTRLTPGKRHPTVGNGCLVGANALVLGNIRLGDGCRVGAGSVVLNDVPDGVTVVGSPARIVGVGQPNPAARLEARTARLEARICRLERLLNGRRQALPVNQDLHLASFTRLN